MSVQNISPAGLALIKEFEGLKLKAYKCPAGIWTIGYGHTHKVLPGSLISEKQAEAYLLSDVVSSVNCVNSHNLGITQTQFDALVSFVFNIGCSAFSRSTLLKKVKENPFDYSIRQEFNRWNRVYGVVWPGLVRRRAAEANLYFSKK